MIAETKNILIFELLLTFNSNGAITETKTNRRPTVASTAVIFMHRMGVGSRDLLPLFNHNKSFMLPIIDEIWKPVFRFENLYEVSNHGRIRRTDSKRIRKINYRSIYPSIELSDNKNKLNVRVHRLVAIAFCPRIPGKNHVNHIDGNKRNNFASNLEWVTQAENNLHAFRVLHRKPSLLGHTPWNKKISDPATIREFDRLNREGISTELIGPMFGIVGSTVRRHLRKLRKVS